MNEGHRFSARRKGEVLRPILQRALDAQGFGRTLPRRISPEVWAHAVGPQLAARVTPTVLSHGTLHLLVEDHRWRDQIDAARLFVLEKLNRRLGKGVVRELKFGLAHKGALDEPRRLAGLGPARAEASIEPLRVLGAARLDPGLREAVLRAAEAAARRAARA